MKSQLSVANNHQSIEWSRMRIQDTLSIYRPEFICVTSAYSVQNSTIAQVCVPQYPFTRPGHIDYITASMASLIVAQMGYLHIRYLVTESANPLLSDVTDSDYLTSRDAGDIVFRKEVLKYQRKLPTRETVRCVISNTHLHKSRNSRIGAYSIEIGGGAITGDGIIALLLPENSHGDR